MAGAVFYHTGIRPSAFAISLDLRTVGEKMLNLRELMKGYIPSTWIIASIL